MKKRTPKCKPDAIFTQHFTRRDFFRTFSLGALTIFPFNQFIKKCGDAAMKEFKNYDKDSLLIRNGMIVTPGELFKGDIRIKNEKIAEIGINLDSLSPEENEIDAEGLHILPGGIDPHVHLTPPWVDDFMSGSQAALAGGITTLGSMCYSQPETSPLAAVKSETDRITQQAIADIILHPVLSAIPTESTFREFPHMVSEGHTSIKIFMVTENFDRGVSQYLTAIREAGENGILSMIHCEDAAIINDAVKKLMAEGFGSLKYYWESRPVVSEVVATQRAVALCEATGSPVYIVHLSSERALKVCEEAQKRGLPVYVETRPLYLHLTRERYNDPDGAIYIGMPPLQEKHDVKALWKGLADGTIHTVATDHAPWTREQKLDPSLSVSNVRAGVNNLQVMLPMLYSEGVLNKKISLKRLIEVTSSNPAKLFGLYPRKGTISTGSDADLVLWNFNEKRIIKDEDMLSRAGFSVYSGTEVTGWPAVTIRRGEIVYKDRQILGKKGSGELIRREQFYSLNK